jgi:DNA-binding transcriptional regulator YiaG
MTLTSSCPDDGSVTTSPRTVEQLAEARALIASGEARHVRRAARLSLADVAAAIPADLSAVGRWERGQRVPRGPAALKYAQLITRLRVQLETSSHSAVQPANLDGGDGTCPSAS